jgi:glutamine kinase
VKTMPFSTDPAPFQFGTKAQTLALLAPRVSLSCLCDQIIVPVADWRENPADMVGAIVSRMAPRRLAVRSSSTIEDTAEHSNAGAFHSVTGVESTDHDIRTAMESVIASYGDQAGDQEVLVQPMVEDVVISGVVLTRDLDTGGPYYVINYDDFSGRTDTVTGGAESKTVLVHRANPAALHSPRMQAIIAAARELEAVCGREELDIEFCMTRDLDVYVLQVRPLAAQRQWKTLQDGDIDAVILDIRAELAELMVPQAGISGTTTIFGEMPDWNPAEMIGTSPRPLAISLYRKQITNRVWSAARAQMGYRDVDQPLMVDFAGRPYIDTRLSFNSFLPADLDEAIAARLVNDQLAGLAEQPDLHDKIEFELAVTCLAFDHDRHMARLRDNGFANHDIDQLTQSLHRLTSAALQQSGAGIRNLLAITDTLLTDGPDLPSQPLQRVRYLLDRSREFGTLPFSMLARHGFIAASFLKSMVSRDFLSDAEADLLMRSVHTVASDIVADMASVTDGDLLEVDFLARYGHLRPGTYDILSWRYDERPDLYLGHDARPPPVTQAFELSPGQSAALENCLKEFDFAISADELLDYICATTAAREQAKFAFSRGISDALAALVQWGEEVDISREMLSFMDIEDLLDSEPDVALLKEKAVRRQSEYDVTRSIYLPHLVVEPDDIDVIRLLRGQATFITGKSVTARPLQIDAHNVRNLDGHIVMIESADPGFDWIFSHRISALVTKFGGANSHMAIRCAEFGLPAAIGCGEKTFNDLTRAQAIELNCAERTVRPVGVTR